MMAPECIALRHTKQKQGNVRYAHCVQKASSGERQSLTRPLFFLTSLRTTTRTMLNTTRAPPNAMIRMTTGTVSPLLSRHHLLHEHVVMIKDIRSVPDQLLLIEYLPCA